MAYLSYQLVFSHQQYCHWFQCVALGVLRPRWLLLVSSYPWTPSAHEKWRFYTTKMAYNPKKWRKRGFPCWVFSAFCRADLCPKELEQEFPAKLRRAVAEKKARWLRQRFPPFPFPPRAEPSWVSDRCVQGLGEVMFKGYPASQLIY